MNVPNQKNPQGGGQTSQKGCRQHRACRPPAEIKQPCSWEEQIEGRRPAPAFLLGQGRRRHGMSVISIRNSELETRNHGTIWPSANQLAQGLCNRRSTKPH